MCGVAHRLPGAGTRNWRMKSSSSREDIAAIQVRIAKAESERDTWRSSGRQEKYLEAYSMVEALELQLDRLRKAPPSVGKRDT